ncbi:hypothetical protein HPB51_008886 [Rhipicephalus microplus]|uniref:Uncharacterized protein n=1 Tax=Rhipicephalus microplus TaxID=6941 RepID=A0A9J6D8L6_RHIMP|nr:hypothetical protein HPB51_008886 [Rhipicephalus microplus]
MIDGGCASGEACRGRPDDPRLGCCMGERGCCFIYLVGKCQPQLCSGVVKVVLQGAIALHRVVKVPSAEPQCSKLNRRKSGDDGRFKTKVNTPSAEDAEPASEPVDVDASLATLTRLAHNPECLDTILFGLQRHLAAIIELTLLVDGDRLQRPLAALFNRILLA